MAGISISAVLIATLGVAAPAQATGDAQADLDETVEGLSEDIERSISELQELEVWEAPAEVNRESTGGDPEGEWGEQASEQVDEEQMRQADEATPFTGPEASEMLGVLPYYALHTAELFANTTAGVNLATGNLVIGATQVELSSAGVPAVYTDHYNSLDSTDGSLGGQWRSGIGQDTGLSFTDDDETELLYRDASGFNQYFTLDDDGEWASPDGLNATLTEDDGDFHMEYHRTGQHLRFNEDGYLLESTDRNGVGVSFSYEGGEVSSVEDPAGRVTEVSYDDDTITYTFPDGEREVVYTQDSNGRLASAAYIRGDGSSDPETIQQINYSYNSDGLLSELRAEFNHTDSEIGLEVAYDSNNRVSQLTHQRFYPDGSGGLGAEERTTGFSYSEGETVVTDRAGEDSTFAIDELGRQTSATDQLGRTRDQEWTANSDITSTTSGAEAGGPAGDITIYEYDDAGNRTDIELPTGAAASAAYQVGDACDNGGSGNAYQVKCTTDPEGNEATYDYDSSGNLLSITDENTGVEEFSHTREDSDRSVCNGFEGMICSTTNAEGETTSFTYSDNGDLIEVSQPSLGVTTIEYDSISRVTGVTAPDGTEYTYQYYVGQNFGPVTITDGDETVILDNVHDRMETAGPYTWEDSTWAGFYLSKQSSGEEIYGDPLTEAFTHQSEASHPHNFVRAHDVEPRGLPAQMTTLYQDYGASPEISATENFTYDAAAQLQYMTVAGAAADDSCSASSPSPAGGDCVAFTYDSNGNPIEQIFPGGAIKETEYDASSRPTRITVTDASDEVAFDVSYSYTDDNDADRGLIQSKTSHVEEGVPAGAVTTYTYDSLNRLIEAEEVDGDGDVNASWEYAYDGAGNRTEVSSSGDTGRDNEDLTYSYDADNLIIGSSTSDDDYTHDDNGNLTSNPDTGLEASYGARDDAQSFTLDGDTVEAQIFGETNNDRKLFNGQVEYRSDTGLHRIADEDNPEEGVTYSLDPRGGSAFGMKETDGDTPAIQADTTFFVTDNLGSVVVLLDNDGEQIGGYSYDPYGQERAITEGEAEENFIRYAGAQYDIETGLYKMGHRYYDPSTGRFTQPDPSGAENNQFAYAGNNPINYVDPTGLLSGSFSGSGCFTFVCGEIGLSIDPDESGWDQFSGHVAAGPGVSSGIAGSGDVGVTGDRADGFFGQAGCDAAFGAGGNASVSYDSQGNWSGTGGVTYGYGASCSAMAGLQF